MSVTSTNSLPMNVLCGQDKRLEEEEGNKILKALISENVERYNCDANKVRKMKMTSALLEEFKIRSNGGSFYKYDKTNSVWILCDDASARDKISHALRFQMKYRTRRSRLQRSNSVPLTPPLKKRKLRSESFDSCPGKIQTNSTERQKDDSDASQPTTRDFNSVTLDPLIVYEDMVFSGELDDLFSNNLFKNMDNIDDVDILTEGVFTEISTMDDDNASYYVSDLDDDI